MTLLSAFGGGLWIIPLGLFLASVWSFYRAVKQWNSGSIWWGKDERGVAKQFTSDEKVGFFSIGATIFGVIFLVAAIGAVIWMNLEK
jgi:hypothetical protein